MTLTCAAWPQLQFNDGHLVIAHEKGSHFENDLTMTLIWWEKQNPTNLCIKNIIMDSKAVPNSPSLVG